MLVYVLRRLISLVPVGFGVVTLVALLTHAVPGDPVDQILGPYASEEDRQDLRSDLGLDQSLPRQLINYYQALARGDLGVSLIEQRPVSEMIAERLRRTIELALVSILVAIILSLPLGILSAVFANTAIDYFAMFFALAGVAIPNFWLASLLIMLFSLHLDWLPVSERGNWQSYILPAVTMGTALAAALSRMTRNSVLDTLQEDYVRTARAKGVGEFFVVVKHVLRNAALPLVTVVGLQFGVLLAGAIVTESIFDWQGLGTLLLQSVRTRDYPIIQALVLLFSSCYLVVNLITDLVYAIVDPRVKLEESEA